MLLLAILFSALLIFVHSSPTPPTRDSRDLYFMQTLQEIEQWSPSWKEERLEVEMMEDDEEVLCSGGEQEICWRDGRRRCVMVSRFCSPLVKLTSALTPSFSLGARLCKIQIRAEAVVRLLPITLPLALSANPTTSHLTASTGKGIDCNSLPGVASSSCRAGRCEARASFSSSLHFLTKPQSLHSLLPPHLPPLPLPPLLRRAHLSAVNPTASTITRPTDRGRYTREGGDEVVGGGREGRGEVDGNDGGEGGGRREWRR